MAVPIDVGTGERELPLDHGATIAGASWSPDGRSIAYGRLPQPDAYGCPVYAPDGTHIAVVSETDATDDQLVILSADFTGPRRIDLGLAHIDAVTYAPPAAAP